MSFKYSYQKIIELKKRIELKMTEHEVLVKLIEEAQKEGERLRKDMERFKKITSELMKFFEEGNMLFTDAIIKDIPLKYKRAVGIDGSFKIVGGAGGRWYAPFSVARVVFEDLNAQPYVETWASIELIQASEDYIPGKKASLLMLNAESKAIPSDREAYVFIDGPIVDPPWYKEKGYIKDRCEKIKICLKKSAVIGCVKKVRDKFYINYLKDLIPKEWNERLDQFSSDQDLIAHVFNQFRSKGYYGPLFTKWIDVSTSNPLYKSYKDEGIHIVCLFFQKDARSRLLRLDVPFLESPDENVERVNNEILHIVKAVNEWTYSGQSLPIPVLLAHNKCTIRKGCAEVLYREIITRARAVDPYIQTILAWIE